MKASEWARKKAEELCTEEHQSWHTLECGQCAYLAAALDAARAEGAMLADQEVYKRGLLVGAERERWECYKIAGDFSERLGGSAGAVAIRINARGPMRGPEDGVTPTPLTSGGNDGRRD